MKGILSHAPNREYFRRFISFEMLHSVLPIPDLRNDPIEIEKFYFIYNLFRPFRKEAIRADIYSAVPELI